MREIFIHSTAIVENNVSIGDGTKIWVNSQIRTNAKIGKNCIISKDTYIDENVEIGNFVKIQNGVSVYHGVTIEDNVFIGPNVAFTNDLYPRAVGDWEVKETLIKKGASIGANATIVCGHVIGENAMVGAGSVIEKNVPDNALVVGNPARIIGYVCECGNKLNEEGVCNKCGKQFNFDK